MNSYTLAQDEHAACLECGHEVYGRTDKKFCCDSCRSRYNNRIRATRRSIRVRTLRSIERNYGILEKILESGLHSYDMAALCDVGFRKENMTGLRKFRSGHMECRCFDLTYCITERKIFNLSRIELPDL